MSIFITNPSRAAQTAVIQKVFFANSSEGLQTTTSTTAVSALTLTTDEASYSATNYIVFWSAIANIGSTSADVIVSLSESGIKQTFNLEPQDTTDVFSVGGVYSYSGGTNRTFEITFNSETGTAVNIDYPSIFVLQAGPRDVVNTQVGGFKTSTSYSNVVVVTIPEDGDYLIGLSASISAIYTNMDMLYEGVGTWGITNDIYDVVAAGDANSQFGNVVAINPAENRVIVGAPNNSNVASRAGAVYIGKSAVQSTGGSLVTSAKQFTTLNTRVTANDAIANARFGTTVAVSNFIANSTFGPAYVVGAPSPPFNDVYTGNTGTVYLFKEEIASGTSSYVQYSKLQGLANSVLYANSMQLGGGGVAVNHTGYSASGTANLNLTVVASSKWADTHYINATQTSGISSNARGGVWVWYGTTDLSTNLSNNGLLLGRDYGSGLTWPAASAAGPEFGESISLFRNTIVVGAPSEYNPATTGYPGAVYAFQRVGNTWVEEGIMRHSAPEGGNGAHADRFGGSVSLYGNTVAIGAIGYESSQGPFAGNTGAVLFFERNVFPQVQVLDSNNISGSFNFGIEMAVDGDYLVISDDRYNSNTGGVHVYKNVNNTWSKQTTLIASDAEQFDYFGFHVDIANDIIVVGAPYANNPANTIANTGAVYVFKRSGDTWSEQQILTANNAATNDNLGYHVKISNNQIFAGAVQEDAGNGAIYVYTANSTGGYVQTQIITANNGELNDFFGYALDVYNGYGMVVGAPYAGNSVSTVYPGKIYTFTSNSTGGWTQQGSVIGAESVPQDEEFGVNVKFDSSGEYIAVSSPGSFAYTTGAVYVYHISGTVLTNEYASLTKEARLVPSYDVRKQSGVSSTEFGYSLDWCDDYIVVGATAGGSQNTHGVAYIFGRENPTTNTWSELQSFHDPGIPISGVSNSGFGYGITASNNYIFIGSWSNDRPVFVYENNYKLPWSQQAKLTANGAGNTYFGWAAAISNNTIVISAPRETNDSFTVSGAVYVFNRANSTSTVWTQEARLVANDTFTNQLFGNKVDIQDDTIIVGASDQGGTTRGAAYVFTRTSNVWSQVQKLTGNNSWTNFGRDVSIAGNTIAVGAYSEFAGGVGGAVYVFTSNTTGGWNQEQVIQAGDNFTGDTFGQTVSLDKANNNILAVGAYLANNGTFECGAAYVFTRAAGTWSQQVKLTPSTASVANKFYGFDISINNGTLVVSEGQSTSRGAFIYSSNSTGFYNSSTEQILYEPHSNTSSSFPDRVYVNGNTIIATATLYDSGTFKTNVGAAFVYRKYGNYWRLVHSISGRDCIGTNYFGTAVAIEGNTAVIGAYGPGSASYANAIGRSIPLNSGSAYVYQYEDPDYWTQQQQVIDGSISNYRESYVDISPTLITGSSQNMNFGRRLSMDRSQLIVSGNTSVGKDEPGEVYILSKESKPGAYNTSGLSWKLDQAIRYPHSGRPWGTAVAIQGNTAVVTRADPAGGSGFGGVENCFVLTKTFANNSQTANNTYAQDATSFVPYFRLSRVSKAKKGDVVTLRYKSSTPGQSVEWKQATVVALNLDDFQSYNVGYANSDRYTLETTTTTFSEGAGNRIYRSRNNNTYHAILASAQIGGGATTSSTLAQCRNTTSGQQIAGITVREPNATTERYDLVGVAVAPGYIVTNNNIGWSFQSESGAAAIIDNPNIMVLNTGNTAPEVLLVGSRSSSASSVVALPTGIAVDDLMILASVSDTVVQSHPAGWTALANTGANATPSLYVSYRYRTGSEGTTVTGLSTTAAHITMAFRGIDSLGTNSGISNVQVATTATGMPNPAAVTVDSANSVVLIIGGVDDDAFTGAGAPTDYTSIASNNYVSGGSAATVVSAYRDMAQTTGQPFSEDPGAFTGTGNDQTVAFTILLTKAPPS